MKNSIKLECAIADVCLPDYWSGHHLAHISVPVDSKTTMEMLKADLVGELMEGAIMGSDDRAHFPDHEESEEWFKAAIKAVAEIKATSGSEDKPLFDFLDEFEDEDGDDDFHELPYAFFVFVDK